MAAAIQFFRGVDEPVVPDIRLTRSRDGRTGQALFVFEEPDALAPETMGDITGMFLVDEEGEFLLSRADAALLNFQRASCTLDASVRIWSCRVDDVVNVSGHRIGTAEVESALVSHAKVAEAAVAPMPHEIKGQGLYAFITLKDGVQPSEELKKELIAHVRKEIGPIAAPDKIQFAPGLPKTRSGKIMRRILRKIAENQTEQIGDVSTLADPGVVDSLVKGKQ
jgi:photosystem II reaction center protein Psb28